MSPTDQDKNGIKALLQNTIWFAGANVIAKILSLFSFPLIARSFSTSDFGLIELFATIPPFVAFSVSFGQDIAVAKIYNDRAGFNKIRELISEYFFFQFFAIGLVAIALCVFSPSIAKNFPEIQDGVPNFRIVFLQAPFFLFYSFALMVLKWSRDRRLFLILFLSSASAYTAWIILGTQSLGINVQELLLLNLINQAIFGFLGLWFIRKWIVIPRTFRHLPEILLNAAPFGITAVLTSALPLGERWLTAEFMSVQAVGTYAAGARVAILVTFMAEAFQIAWGPYASQIHRGATPPFVFERVLVVFATSMLAFAFFLSAIATQIIDVIATARYSEGAEIVFPLALGLALLSIANLLEVSLGIAKQPNLVLLGTVARVILNFGFLLFLTPLIGLQGVAVSAAVGCAIQSGISAVLLNQYVGGNWDFRPIYGVLISSGVCSFFLIVARSQLNANLFSCVAIGGALVVTIAGSLSYFRIERQL